jgi:quercetin dioxygenase-like cupin family protein
MGVVHHCRAEQGTWTWAGVAVESYTSGATKQVVIGPQDGAPNFAVRFFTLPAKGLSNLDYHEHDHGVVVMQGRARVMLGSRYEEIGPGDVVYIPGWERHQFETLGDEPFTFLCVIPPKTAQPDACALPATTIVEAVTEEAIAKVSQP